MQGLSGATNAPAQNSLDTQASVKAELKRGICMLIQVTVTVIFLLVLDCFYRIQIRLNSNLMFRVTHAGNIDK